MLRSKFDPPEYQSWQADAGVMRAYRARLETNRASREFVRGLPEARLLGLYAGMVRARLFDTMLKRWVKQGVISKAWLGTGEEAVSVGCAQALAPGDRIGPMIRNAAACFEMGMSLVDHFAGYLGTTQSTSAGRDLHVGDLAHGVVAPISHVGSLLPVMCGTALAMRLRGESRVAMTWVGDGATRTGEVHEAVNYAAVERLPLVIVVQNNQVALGTRTERESRGAYCDWLRGYGIPVAEVDGNHVVDVFTAASQAVAVCRRGEGPVGIVAETFRMGGHATHDEAEARALFDADTFSAWGKRDPLGCFEAWLLGQAVNGEASPKARRERDLKLRAQLEALERRLDEEVEAAAQAALDGRRTHAPDPGSVAQGVYAHG